MHERLSARLEFFRVLAKRPLARYLFVTWALISIYDTAGSQFLPAQWAQKLPKVYQVVAMTSGWLPWQAWLLIGAIILVAFAIEYPVRRVQPLGTQGNSAPIEGAPRPKLSVPALVLIAVGVMAAGFAGWYVFSLSSSTVNESPIVSAPPIPPTGATVSKLTFTRAALEQRQEALKALNAMVDKLSDEFNQAKGPIFDKWPQELPVICIKGYVAALENLEKFLDGAANDLNAGVNRYRYEDITSMTDWSLPKDTIKNLTMWKETVAGIPERECGERPLPQKAMWSTYVETMGNLEGWIAKLKQSIINKRTEYDRATVYQ